VFDIGGNPGYSLKVYFRKKIREQMSDDKLWIKFLEAEWISHTSSYS